MYVCEDEKFRVDEKFKRTDRSTPTYRNIRLILEGRGWEGRYSRQILILVVPVKGRERCWSDLKSLQARCLIPPRSSATTLRFPLLLLLLHPRRNNPLFFNSPPSDGLKIVSKRYRSKRLRVIHIFAVNIFRRIQKNMRASENSGENHRGSRRIEDSFQLQSRYSSHVKK